MDRLPARDVKSVPGVPDKGCPYQGATDLNRHWRRTVAYKLLTVSDIVDIST